MRRFLLAGNHETLLEEFWRTRKASKPEARRPDNT
jgi:hypothetical protein